MQAARGHFYERYCPIAFSHKAPLMNEPQALVGARLMLVGNTYNSREEGLSMLHCAVCAVLCCCHCAAPERQRSVLSVDIHQQAPHLSQHPHRGGNAIQGAPAAHTKVSCRQAGRQQKQGHRCFRGVWEPSCSI